MPEADAVDSLLESVQRQDARKRIEIEKKLLADAESLTNGKEGCTSTIGSVLYGLAEMSCEQSSMLRGVLSVLPEVQRKSDCAATVADLKKCMGRKWEVNPAFAATVIVCVCVLAGTIAGIVYMFTGGR